MYVANYLEAHADHEVQILNCQVENSSDSDNKNFIEHYRPHLVGISTWTDYWYDAWQCIQIIKSVDPSIHVSVGGPLASIYPETILEYSGCDSVIVGDGEVPFYWLANGISNSDIPDTLPGVHIKSRGVQLGDQNFYIHGKLDTLAPPVRTMLPYKIYVNVIGKSTYSTTMITSRGCPYSCTFCKLSFQITLSHSAEYVVMVPYAGTEIYDEGLRIGIIPVDYWQQFAKHPEPNFVLPFFWEEFLSQKQLLQLRDEGTRGFYFRPRYLLREIRKLSTISELKRKAKMAASLFQSSVMGVGHSLYTKGPQLKNTRTSGAGGYANNKANPYSVRE